MAMGMSTRQNGADLCVPPLHIDTGVTADKNDIAQTKRVNVDYSGEWKDKAWRLFIRDNIFVSKPATE
jgi:DNA-3-methyladenine glycosylase